MERGLELGLCCLCLFLFGFRFHLFSFGGRVFHGVFDDFAGVGVYVDFVDGGCGFHVKGVDPPAVFLFEFTAGDSPGLFARAIFSASGWVSFGLGLVAAWRRPAEARIRMKATESAKGFMVGPLCGIRRLPGFRDLSRV